MQTSVTKKPKQIVLHVFTGKKTAEELLAKILKCHPDSHTNKDNSIETHLTS